MHNILRHIKNAQHEGKILCIAHYQIILWTLNITRSEKLEDIKGVIRSRTSKDRKYNHQKKNRLQKDKSLSTKHIHNTENYRHMEYRIKMQNCKKMTKLKKIPNNSHNFEVIAHLKE